MMLNKLFKRRSKNLKSYSVRVTSTFHLKTHNVYVNRPFNSMINAYSKRGVRSEVKRRVKLMENSDYKLKSYRIVELREVI